MGIFIFAIANIIICINILNAQRYLPNVIVFQNHRQIYNFPTTYPECTVIEADVIIVGNELSNLESSSIICDISGMLVIDSAKLIAKEKNPWTDISFEGIEIK